MRLESISLHELRDLLHYVTANDREIWCTVGMGIKAEFGQDGFDAWDIWSQSGTGYKAADAKTVWRSFRAGGIGIGTVIKLAQDAGWKRDKGLTADDKRRLATEHEQRRKARKAEIEADEARLERMRGQVSVACQSIWQDHVDLVGQHPYLERKHVEARGVGFARRLVVLEIDDQAERCQIWTSGEATRWLQSLPKPRPAHLSMLVIKAGDLLVPLRSADGHLWALQVINDAGKKLFPKYGRKSGCMHWLVPPDDPAVIGIGEGYATVASCRQADGWAMVAAFDAGNLLSVARTVRAKFPAARIVICGDDDAADPDNPGRRKAEAAALEVGGVAVFPAVGDEGVSRDWNDLHVDVGLAAVRDQLLAALDQKPAIHASPVAAVSSGQDLPPAPSDDAASAVAATPEGCGEDAGAVVLQRYALIEGTTKVFDAHKRVAIKKTAFELLVTKPVATAWFNRADKKCIDEAMAKRLEDQTKLGRRDAGSDEQKLPPTKRYVYIDGTQDVWDAQRRRRIQVGSLKVALGDNYPLWLNSPERRVIDQSQLVFDPCMQYDQERYINTFEGLPLEPVHDNSKCAAIIEMIDFLCNGDRQAVHWLTCWLALPLQQVGTKMATAVLMHSTMEGSGKSLLLSDIMRVIYGDYGATVGQVQLESQWSAWQSAKLYGVFEEVVSRDQRYNQVGKIKHMVTGKTMRIESKFISGWEEANYMNAVFLSNEIIPWPISENDRRMLVLWPEITLQGDLLRRALAEKDSDGIQALYGYLLSYPLDDFDAHTRPPRTDARRRLVALSRASWQTFLAEWQHGLLGDGLRGPCTSSDLYALFLEWCSRNKEHTLSHTKFAGFIGSQVMALPGTPWRELSGHRRFATFFLPPPPVGEPPYPLGAEWLGQRVEAWRKAAMCAGWSVDDWEHIKPRSA